MSSLPGFTLEDYLLWNYNLTADSMDDANISLGIATALGNITPRPNLTTEELSELASIFEPYREQIEYLLEEFDEENMSWRDYAGYSFDFIDEQSLSKGESYLSSISETRWYPHIGDRNE